MARYFYDCEFIEDGTTIELVSVGAVDEQGREFYAISTQFVPMRAGPWVRRNVLDRLTKDPLPLTTRRRTPSSPPFARSGRDPGRGL